MTPKEELQNQLTEVFGKATFPIKSVMDLLPVLPQGPMTSFSAGDKSWTAMELSQKFGGSANFPYDDVNTFVTDLISGLESAGEI